MFDDICKSAEMCHYGIETPVDHKTELRLLEEAAGAGSTRAQYLLGVKLSLDTCGVYDPQEGRNYLFKILNADLDGDDRQYLGKAARMMGYLSLDQKDHSSAKDFFQGALKSGTLDPVLSEDVEARIRDIDRILEIQRKKKEEEQARIAEAMRKQQEQERIAQERERIAIEKEQARLEKQVAKEQRAQEKQRLRTVAPPSPPPAKKSKWPIVIIILGMIILLTAALGMCGSGNDQDDYGGYEDYYSGDGVYNPYAYEGYEDDFVFSDSDQRYLDYDEVEYLNEDDTQWAINEIYARHGLIFREEEFDDFYNSCEWYEPTYTLDVFDDGWFNEYERENIRILVEHRDEFK